MGNQSSINQTHLGFEDIQRAIFDISRYCLLNHIPAFHEWSPIQFTQFQSNMLQHPPPWILINTMEDSPQYQTCLIPHTIPPSMEETIVNWLLQNKLHTKIKVILYGKHECDEKPHTKLFQFSKLGFPSYLYVGGMFQWLSLQDIYGNGSDMNEDTTSTPFSLQQITKKNTHDEIEFPTTTVELDILRYRPTTRFPLMLTD